MEKKALPQSVLKKADESMREKEKTGFSMKFFFLVLPQTHAEIVRDLWCSFCHAKIAENLARSWEMPSAHWGELADMWICEQKIHFLILFVFAGHGTEAAYMSKLSDGKIAAIKGAVLVSKNSVVVHGANVLPRCLEWAVPVSGVSVAFIFLLTCFYAAVSPGRCCSGAVSTLSLSSRRMRTGPKLKNRFPTILPLESQFFF